MSSAGVYGDPHFRTFDGTLFTFNGHGEFWLVKSNYVTIDDWTGSFKLQARFEAPAQQNGE